MTEKRPREASEVTYEKLPKIVDATILSDGVIQIDMNVKMAPFTTKSCLLTPEALLSLVREYGAIPPAAETEIPGIPILEEEAIFEDEDEVEETG